VKFVPEVGRRPRSGRKEDVRRDTPSIFSASDTEDCHRRPESPNELLGRPTRCDRRKSQDPLQVGSLGIKSRTFRIEAVLLLAAGLGGEAEDLDAGGFDAIEERARRVVEPQADLVKRHAGFDGDGDLVAPEVVGTRRLVAIGKTHRRRQAIGGRSPVEVGIASGIDGAVGPTIASTARTLAPRLHAVTRDALHAFGPQHYPTAIELRIGVLGIAVDLNAAWARKALLEMLIGVTVGVRK